MPQHSHRSNSKPGWVTIVRHIKLAPQKFPRLKSHLRALHAYFRQHKCIHFIFRALTESLWNLKYIPLYINMRLLNKVNKILQSEPRKSIYKQFPIFPSTSKMFLASISWEEVTFMSCDRSNPVGEKFKHLPEASKLHFLSFQTFSFFTQFLTQF